jgi:glycosyltransferase involved in cell wall biosynthesis
MTRVLRVYHAGRDPGHRRRERALVAAGVDLTLVVPAAWPDAGSEKVLTAEPFRVVELATSRSGDVNRHRYTSSGDLRRALDEVRPDLLDVHEEPFSLACRQWLAAAGQVPVVAYTAQNVDKRFPPPFSQYETAALRRLRGIYPCSWQAASVVRGKGFDGLLDVLPLGYDEAVATPGTQDSRDEELILGLVGRLVPEKGVRDAVEVLARLRMHRPARLLLVGQGPELEPARGRARELGVADALEVLPWQSAQDMAALYRRMHVVLVPSRATATWVEQFGRVIVEAQAAGALVAAYASGAIPEVAGDAALLVPEGDVDALAETVIGLLQQPERFAGLRARGLAAVRDLTWTAVGQRQAAFYERVLSTAPVARAGGTPSQRHRRAEAEFGPSAVLAGGVRRPFALPVLREDRPWTRALGSALDAVRR